MERISQFSKEKAELEEKLENRESLEEDLQRIRNLEVKTFKMNNEQIFM